MEIIVDDRERAVVPFLEDLSHNLHINYKIQHLTTGDYAICYNERIMIVFERKTYIDLAASLRDGRSANINKLITLRESTGCQICYLIEGPAFPNPDAMFSRMPYKNLRSHLDHLAFRDQVHMIYSKNQEHTAYRLFELAKNYATIKPSPFLNISTTNTNQNKLTEKQVSIVSIQEQLLRCLPGIGSIIATILAEESITLYGIYHSLYTAEQIARFKYTSGGSIGLAKAQKIFDSKKILISKSTVNKKIQIRILCTIPLISKQTAEKILSIIEFKDIMEKNVTIDILKDIERSPKSKLGTKAASNIIEKLVPNVANELIVNESVANESVVNESVVNESVANKSVVNESVANESVVNESVANESVVNESVANESVVNESVANESVANELIVNESVVNESVANKSVVEKKKLKKKSPIKK